MTELELFSVDDLPLNCSVEVVGRVDEEGKPVWLCFRAVEMPCLRRWRLRPRVHHWSGKFDVNLDDPIRIRWKDLVSL